VCRALLQDGIHPGATSFRTLPDASKVQIGEAKGRRGHRWSSAKPSDLNVCRAQVTSSAGKKAIDIGKAYRSGYLADHCFAGFEDSEVDVITGFELLYSPTETR
jgi:hypothetical protein